MPCSRPRRLAWLSALSAALWLGCEDAATTPGAPIPAVDGGAAPKDAAPKDTGPPGDPCLGTDRDQDGFGSDPACDAPDCDDSNISIHPGAPEACNGIDDDCDRDVDEDLGTGTCGVGACVRSLPNCEDGRPARCTPGAPGTEICNALDDDCDGAIDEDVRASPCGVGLCEAFPTCTAGTIGPCAPGAPSPESCNRADDDCNGTVDDGFRASYVGTTYTVIQSFSPGCDGFGERLGLLCNAAMHRFCEADGCTTSGFGPLENSGDNLAVGCVVALPPRETPFSVLGSHHPGCDGSLARIGPECSAAIHRYCRSEGHETGFGPVETAADTASVVCLETGRATVLETTYTELTQRHGGCHGANPQARWGPDCNAAISRFCGGAGFTTGYGPVENIDDRAVVVCVTP